MSDMIDENAPAAPLAVANKDEDPEFHIPTGGQGDEDDDSIAAEDDIADEEEVNSLMKVGSRNDDLNAFLFQESEMSLADLLATYGIPNNQTTVETTTVDDAPTVSSSGRPQRKRRRAPSPNPEAVTPSTKEQPTNDEAVPTTSTVAADKTLVEEVSFDFDFISLWV